MKNTNVYLHFDGNCRPAMMFYGRCFGAEPNLTPIRADSMDAGSDRILHAELKSGPMVLMAADTLPGTPFQQGTNFSLSIDCDSETEMDGLFAALSAGGKVTMPIHIAFWGGRFGMLTDPFGISWMLSFREDTAQ